MTTLPQDEKFLKLQAVLEEILVEEELRPLLEQSEKLRHYIGFEISGKVHIGSGLMSMRVIKELQALGVHTGVFLADWHSYINKKLGGDIQTIREVAVSYFKEAMIASALCVGADPSKIEFILADDVYNADFWMTTLDVASNITLSRGKRSVDIAGREVGDEMPIAILFYPPMQIADIFNMNIHLAHAGTDQRKAHVVARDITSKMRHKVITGPDGNPMKPIALHHHLLQGLAQPPTWPIPEAQKREVLISMKMSKSRPDTAVFIHDSPEDIQRKVQKAFCPPNETRFNPIIDWVEHLIFPLRGTFQLKRSEQFGGHTTFETIDALKEAYTSSSIHPSDLKNATTEYLIDILLPARQHFEQPERKAALERVETLRITR